ncbi:hypothetical protein M9H77_12126 [Catharanthus roseus]|uniref:Uncharacterized protein n=1 Tax=Catharanthus roseus TaxID=4058 RepID=A0ACC0BGL8_CATRO|nr:hypothetical protein M9H77_12126 [Catharanthus roseus]
MFLGEVKVKGDINSSQAFRMEVSLNIHHTICNKEWIPKEHAESATLQSVKELVMTSPITVDEEEETAQAPEESTSPEKEDVPQGKSERWHDDFLRLKETPQAVSVVEESEQNEHSTGNKSEFEKDEKKRKMRGSWKGTLPYAVEGRQPKIFTGRNLPWTVDPTYHQRWKWAANRETLKIVIENSFDESVIEHFELEHLSGGLGWVPVLRISRDFYPDLICEF